MINRYDNEMKSLGNRFHQIIKSTKNGHKKPEVKALQEDFCYIMDDFQRGPAYKKADLVTEMNNLVNNAKLLS